MDIDKSGDKDYAEVPDDRYNEMLDIVDESNRIIGKTRRKDVHKNCYIHRSVIFFIINKKGKVMVTQRSASKELYPEYYSIALGGHVLSGKTYKDAAVKEAFEEAGVDAAPKYVGYFKKRFDSIDKENIQVFVFIVPEDQQIKLERFELKKYWFKSLPEISEMMDASESDSKINFLPETPILFEMLVGFFKKIKRLKTEIGLET